MSSHEYSQGVCQDGAAILKDGQMMTIEEILAELNNQERLAEALREFSGLDQMSMENAAGFIEDNCGDLRALLDSLEAEKWG